MDLIGKKDWCDFKALIGQHSADTFAQATIIWRRMITYMDRWQEDNDQVQTVDIPLQCLVDYNFNATRAFATTDVREAGELEEQSIRVLFSLKYLEQQGYLDGNGNFDYKPDYDRFILNGLIKKPMGDGGVSQAYDKALWYEIIMIEQRTPTGTSRS